MPSLNEAVVLVTGANGGIGTHFVNDALARGASKVYATARTPAPGRTSALSRSPSMSPTPPPSGQRSRPPGTSRC
ncbi:hypothetical protein AHiyo4_46500 [Arthrobacter sp. Hiyo4]|nr:hypothetical protein AHiyo4_46500 [Arthrobacter sp. Hiyo4]